MKELNALQEFIDESAQVNRKTQDKSEQKEQS